MKVAAYQAHLDSIGSLDIIALIREQIDWCESNGVRILCCPEGVVGGLADYALNANEAAIEVKTGQLKILLRPLSSSSVTTIVGFTEIDDGNLYNSAAVLHNGSVAGVYRKMYPAIN